MRHTSRKTRRSLERISNMKTHTERQCSECVGYKACAGRGRVVEWCNTKNVELFNNKPRCFYFLQRGSRCGDSTRTTVGKLRGMAV
jgi:hypothetical protein